MSDGSGLAGPATWTLASSPGGNTLQAVGAPALPDIAATASDYFGNSVTVSGNIVVAGARLDDDNGPSSGSAYVFERDGPGAWNEVQKLTAFDAASSDSFGVSVSVSGSYLVVGAHLDDDLGNNSGSAYVFERDGGGVWNPLYKLAASDGSPGSNFGVAVAASGLYSWIGAVLASDLQQCISGAAYAIEL